MKQECDKLLLVIKMFNKKFKELRMFIFCVFLFLIFTTIALICFINKDMKKAIIMLVLSFVALSLLLGRYNIILFDQSVILYEWKIFAMLPINVEYNDIQSVEIKSNHHVVVKHKKKTHVYVFNALKFVESLEKKRK